MAGDASVLEEAMCPVDARLLPDVMSEFVGDNDSLRSGRHEGGSPVLCGLCPLFAELVRLLHQCWRGAVAGGCVCAWLSTLPILFATDPGME